MNFVSLFVVRAWPWDLPQDRDVSVEWLMRDNSAFRSQNRLRLVVTWACRCSHFEWVDEWLQAEPELLAAAAYDAWNVVMVGSRRESFYSFWVLFGFADGEGARSIELRSVSVVRFGVAWAWHLGDLFLVDKLGL